MFSCCVSNAQTRSKQKFTPFIGLSRHKRRDAVVRLNWRIRSESQEPGLNFWTDHCLIDPADPSRKSSWIDVYFAGLDRSTLWNAEIITTQLAWDDEIHGLAFNTAYQQLTEAERELEFALSFKPVPRKNVQQPTDVKVDTAAKDYLRTI